MLIFIFGSSILLSTAMCLMLKDNILKVLISLIVVLETTNASAQVKPATRVNFEPYKGIIDLKLSVWKGIKQKAYLIKYERNKIKYCR